MFTSESQQAVLLWRLKGIKQTWVNSIAATRIKISDDTRAVVGIRKAITSADAKMFKLVSGKSIASFIKKAF